MTAPVSAEVAEEDGEPGADPLSLVVATASEELEAPCVKVSRVVYVDVTVVM